MRGHVAFATPGGAPLAGSRVAMIGDGSRPVPFSVMADVAALAAAGLALRESLDPQSDAATFAALADALGRGR